MGASARGRVRACARACLRTCVCACALAESQRTSKQWTLRHVRSPARAVRWRAGGRHLARMIWSRAASDPKAAPGFYSKAAGSYDTRDLPGDASTDRFEVPPVKISWEGADLAHPGRRRD